MDTLAIDIETYSDVSLPDCGVHRYAASEQFEILLFAYSLNDEPTRIIGIAAGLGNVQKLRDGEPLGSRANAKDEFEAVDAEDDFLA